MQLQQAVDLAQRTMDEGSGESAMQRVWIWCHGGRVTALLSVLLGLQCLALRTAPAAMNAAIVLCGACYQRFWARDRQRVRLLLRLLRGLATRLEACSGAEALEYAARTARLLRVSRWVVFLDVPVALVFMVTWPLASGRLTFDVWPSMSTHGMAVFALAYAMQSAVITCSFFCFAGLQLVHATLALVSASLFRIIAGLFERADSATTLSAAIHAHQQLLDLVAELSRVFQQPLFHIHAGALTFALLATRSMITGTLDAYIVGLFPVAFAYCTLLGVEGDAVQESSELVHRAAFAGGWLGAGTSTEVLMVMQRARQPAEIRATWLGALSLPTLQRLLRSWYSLTQMAIRLRV